MAGLTDLEKVQIRSYLGYQNVQGAFAIFAGLPRPEAVAQQLELAMNNILEAAIPRVRECMTVLGTVEQKMVDALNSLIASKLEDLTLRDDYTQRLEEEFNRWAQRLADVFGVPLYGYAARFNSGDGDARAAGGKIQNLRRAR